MSNIILKWCRNPCACREAGAWVFQKYKNFKVSKAAVKTSFLWFTAALLIGVLIAFTALVPIIGAFIGCIVGAFLILLENPTQALLFIVIFLVIQQLEEHLIYPHVVGNSVGLPSIWVLVAITVGGSLMGVLGMLIFIPLVSIVYTLFRGCVYKRLKKRKIQNIS